jgi:hypothetical protein
MADLTHGAGPGQHAADLVLESIVSAVNRSPAGGIPITLYVGGIVVSGEMIGDRQYAELAGREVASGGSETHRRLGQTIADFAVAAVDPAASPQHVNLREVVLAMPGSHTLTVNAVWRGRLAAVDGYSWGRIAR